ncbi:hypothetical protein [Massilia sp. 9096]|uniref:hypothetical protein n=1 Tax=Massilia sp. 9096 TaxID=1500894 RepID=UPI000A54625F|nr:hypothetical protein [Massilia sp. 9096]
MKKITDFPVVRDQLAREAEEKAKQAAQAPTVFARAPGAAGQQATGRAAGVQGAKR